MASQYTYIHVELGDDKPAWYKDKVNPNGTVPAVYDAGKPVLESNVVAEYFEEKFPGSGTSLMPSDVVDRAAVRLFCACVPLAPWPQLCSSRDSRVFCRQFSPAPLYALLTCVDESKRAETEAATKAALATVEARFSAGHPSGPFFLGESLSLADVALLPFVDRMATLLKNYRGYEMLAEMPRVAKAFAAVQSRPAWKATSQAPKFYMDAYSGYASGTPGKLPKTVKASA